VIGDLEAAGPRWRLRFVRRLAHPQEKVWRAVTEKEHLEAWFPGRIIGDWEVGSPLRFESRAGHHEGFDGEVLAFEPMSLVEFRWGPDVIRIEVQPQGSGCVLTLTDAIEEIGKAARDGAGWHTCLDMLECEIAGTERTWTVEDRWAEVHPDYVNKFGAAAATIGPPE
jgi:uncharacterized protein YndB with AHSA1/START domain